MIDFNDFKTYITVKSGLKPNSIRHALSRIKIFLNWLKENKKELNQKSTEEFFIFLKNKTTNNNTLNTYVYALRQLRNYLFHRGILNNFFEGIRSFKKYQPPVLILSEKEVEKIINADTTSKKYKGEKIEKLQFTLQTLRMFLAYTGCRFEEAASLEVKSVDLENQKAVLYYTKNSEPRNVYLIGPLVKRIKKLIENKKPNELVFQNLRGKKIYATDFSKDLKKAALKAGIKKRVHAHIFRHTYGTLLYLSTRDVALVKEVLGHKDIKSTMTYVHIADEVVKEGMLYRHPFAYRHIPPKNYIEIIKKAIEQFKLTEDKRFDYLKVLKTINDFIYGLNEAVLPNLRNI